MTANQRAWLVVGSVVVPPALILGLVALLAGPVVALVVVVVVATGGALWAWRGADARVLTRFGGRHADRRGEARPLNLIEGLSFTAGLHPPALTVVEAEGLNLAVVGRDRSSTTVVATSALLAELSRIELEGVLAAALAEIRRGELGPATMAASLPGVGRCLVSSGAGRDAATDLAAVGLTRFPPGLAAALDKMAARGTAVDVAGPDQAHLWLADPHPGGVSAAGRTSLHDRAEALREL